MRENYQLKAVTVLLVFCLAGCVTTSNNSFGNRGGYQSAVDRAVGKCVATIAAGAIFGAIIGNNTGSGNSKTGMMKGGAIGAVACAFLVHDATEKDKARIRQIELEALNRAKTGPSESTFISEKGETVKVSTTTQNAPMPEQHQTAGTSLDGISTSNEVICRKINTEIDISGQRENLGESYSCRTPDGDWETITV